MLEANIGTHIWKKFKRPNGEEVLLVWAWRSVSRLEVSELGLFWVWV